MIIKNNITIFLMYIFSSIIPYVNSRCKYYKKVCPKIPADVKRLKLKKKLLNRSLYLKIRFKKQDYQNQN